MHFFVLLGLILLACITGLIGSGNNTAAAISAVIFFPTCIAIYFAPAITAYKRDLPNKLSISTLNFFLGWTLIGWVIALVWSYVNQANPQANNAQPPQRNDLTTRNGTTRDRDLGAAAVASHTENEKDCPFCAEKIKAAAIKCKHCGSDMPAPQAEPESNMWVGM